MSYSRNKHVISFHLTQAWPRNNEHVADYMFGFCRVYRQKWLFSSVVLQLSIGNFKGLVK